MAQVLIAGGGIAGLATALSIAGRGHRVTVLEGRDTFAELGAGIQLAPNAFRALDRLGAGRPVRERAVYIDELRLMDGTTGTCVLAMPLTQRYRERFGNPYVVVHRADLYAPLLEACQRTPGIELRTTSFVVGYEQDADGVSVALESGERIRGAALVGADGIRSRVRAQLVGDGEPRVSGHTIYRSVIPMSRVPHGLRSNTVTLWAGPNWHFVHYPIAGGEYLNLAATRDDGARVAVVGQPVEPSVVLDAFAHVGDGAGRLLRLGEGWRQWVVCDRDPVPTWTDGRVVLVGDAAHPMLQYAAQGACQALEDAVCLGDLFDCGPQRFAARFVEFTAARRDRTARITEVSRLMGIRFYHPAGNAARARNRLLSGLSAEQMYDMVAWLHGTGGQPHPAGSARSADLHAVAG
jgi:2-polyprenyl-6-methoxyphenol hydroxylase-like FAD-dependent oxidoreductase